jgi:hypothetical protein
MSLYIAMAYLIRATAGFYVYEFLDSGMIGGLTAAYIFGIGGMGVVGFFVVQGLVWIKFKVIGGGGVWDSDRSSSTDSELGGRTNAIQGQKATRYDTGGPVFTYEKDIVGVTQIKGYR